MGYDSCKMNFPAAKENTAKLNLNRIPKHIAIIMDGNRRWAKSRCMPPIAGHWKGAEALTQIVEAAANLGVKTLTVYSFSTETWNRPRDQIDGLMQLFKMYLAGQRERMIREGVSLDAIGDISKLTSDVRAVLDETKQATAKGNRINLVLALNYGARDDICRAIKALVTECEKGNIKKEEISEQVFSRFVDTAKWGDPELLIRTSGEMRLSNFLLWQISYAEVYLTNVMWPDFTEEDLVQAIADYQRRDKRMGS